MERFDEGACGEVSSSTERWMSCSDRGKLAFRRVVVAVAGTD